MYEDPNTQNPLLQFFQKLAQAQQPEQPEMEDPMATKMYEDILKRYQDPQREQQLRNMQRQTPADISNEMSDRYYGKGTGGKISRILTALTFAPRPDFEKPAQAQWMANQKIAQDEQGSAVKLAQSELTAAQRERASRDMVRTQVMKAQQKQQDDSLKGFLNGVKVQVQQSKNEIDRLKAQSGIDLNTVKGRELEQKMKLSSIWAPFDHVQKAMGKDPASIMAMIDQLPDTPDDVKAAMRQSYATRFEGAQEVMKQKEATPAGTTSYQRPFIDGSGNQIMQNYTTVRNGRPAAGNKQGLSQREAALTRGIAGDQPIINFNRSAAPAAPAVDAPVVPPVPGSVAPTTQITPEERQKLVSDALAAKTEKSKSGYRIAPPEPGLVEINAPVLEAGASGEDVPRAWYKPPSGTATGLKKPMSSAEKSSHDAALSQIYNNRMTLGTMAKAFTNGIMEKRTGMGRSIMETIAPGSPAAIARSPFGTSDPDVLDYENGLQNLNTRTVAAYLKQISGAQVSEKEYSRLAASFPMKTDSPASQWRSVYFNTMVPAALLNLEQMGALNGSTAGKVGDAMRSVLDDWTTKSAQDLKSISVRPPGERKKLLEAYQRSRYMDTQAFMAEALRRAFPNSHGKYIDSRKDGENGVYKIYIPSDNPVIERLGSEKRTQDMMEKASAARDRKDAEDEERKRKAMQISLRP